MDSVGMDTVGMVCLNQPAVCPSDESETDTLAILVESVRVHQLVAVCVPESCKRCLPREHCN